MKNSVFLVIEGSHGSGKTTLARSLRKRLEMEGYSVSQSKEPFSLEIKHLIKTYSRVSKMNPYVLQYLLLADRAVHNEFIKKEFENYDVVISVRYTLSNYVYQRISGIPIDEIKKLNSHFMNPDIWILLKSNFLKRSKRMRKESKIRQQHYFLIQENLLLEQKYYSELFNQLRSKPFVRIINSEKSKMEVANEAFNFIEKKLEKIRK